MYHIEVKIDGKWTEAVAYQDIRSAKAQFTKFVNAHPDKEYRRISVHEVYDGTKRAQGASQEQSQ